jgi:hypothetical protein
MTKSRYFSIQELVAPEILAVLSEEAAWRLIPSEVCWGLDTLRQMYGKPIYINGKGLTQCGVRAVNSSTGALKSGHKLYRGETCFDLHADSLTDLVAIVRANHQQLGIGRIESPSKTPGWFHIAFVKGATTLEEFDP